MTFYINFAIFYWCNPLDTLQLAAVAALCVQYEAEFRPNMSIVVKALSPLLQQRPAPATAEPAPQPVSWNQSYVMGPSACIQPAHSMSHWEYFGYLFCSILSWVQHTWTCLYCLWTTTVRGLMLAPHNGICSRLEVVFLPSLPIPTVCRFQNSLLEEWCRMIWTFYLWRGVAALPSMLVIMNFLPNHNSLLICCKPKFLNCDQVYEI
jgi:hypothetical protein